ASSSSRSDPSSFISSSTAVAILSKTNLRTPIRRLSRMIIRSFSFGVRSPLQLQADVDEVVGGPGAGVLEDQVLVARVDLLDRGVEVGLAGAGDQEGAVEDHLVADRLVGARGDADAAQGIDDLGHQLRRLLLKERV